MNTNLTEKFLLFINSKPIYPNITLNFDHYYVRGTALIHNWCDDRSCVKMKSFEVPADGLQSENEVTDIIVSLLNDNGFGCKAIIGAFVEIWAIYTGFNTDAKQFVKDMIVTKPGETMSEKEKDFIEQCFYEA
jgi:hypothetical protein